MDVVIQIIASGLTLGAMYAVATVGLSLVYGSLNMLNMAHGALLTLGGYICYAAITHDAGKSGGLDQALFEVLDTPFGPVLLCLLGVGLACYGVFTLARARHLAK